MLSGTLPPYLESMMYDALTAVYDRLFPPDLSAHGFLSARVPAPAKVLDIGCATGARLLSLAMHGYQGLGIDPSSNMIRFAQCGTPPSLADRVSFKEGSMADMNRYNAESFDVLLCLGNTLPHLDSQQSLNNFLVDASRILAPEGALIIQLLNHEKILRERPENLPVISIEGWSFMRSYEYPQIMTDRSTVRFSTTLVNEVSRDSFSGSVELFPFTVQEIIDSMHAADLKAEPAQAGWDGSPFDGRQSPVVILVGRKS